MEFITKAMASVFLFLSISSLLLSSPSLADDSAAAIPLPLGTIQRETKQQILATIPPGSHENTEPFLTSPSGKYTGYFLRRETAPGAGGFGNDFCFIQIQDTASGASVWESQCEPVSSENACSLVFSDNGVAVFDGSHSVWESGAGSHNNFPAMLELVDLGDMRVIDKDGELVWKASDEPRVNQGCGLPGSPGLASGSPPFVVPVGGDGNPPFGQPQHRPPYPSNGALPLAAAVSPPVVAPTGGDESLPSDQQPSSGDLPLAPASPPVVAPVGGDGSLPSDQQPSSGDLPLAPASPPIVAPIGGAENPASDQPPSYPTNGASGQQLHGLNGVKQPLGIGGQEPLVDNNPYDSGCAGKGGWIGILFLAVVSQLVLYGL